MSIINRTPKTAEQKAAKKANRKQGAKAGASAFGAGLLAVIEILADDAIAEREHKEQVKALSNITRDQIREQFNISDWNFLMRVAPLPLPTSMSGDELLWTIEDIQQWATKNAHYIRMAAR